MKSIQQVITQFAAILVSVFIVGHVTAQTSEKQDFEAAKREYEQSSNDEAARLTYVNKLAEIYYRFLKNYWATGDKSANYATLVNAELKKHPAPKDSDAKKLSKLLVGKWQSPRRTYVFRANTNWRVQGNQIVWGEGKTASRSTIILLNSEYLIYSEKDAAFFHSRVKE